MYIGIKHDLVRGYVALFSDRRDILHNTFDTIADTLMINGYSSHLKTNIGQRYLNFKYTHREYPPSRMSWECLIFYIALLIQIQTNRAGRTCFYEAPFTKKKFNWDWGIDK